jgi:hypothetical protein
MQSANYFYPISTTTELCQRMLVKFSNMKMSLEIIILLTHSKSTLSAAAKGSGTSLERLGRARSLPIHTKLPPQFVQKISVCMAALRFAKAFLDYRNNV